MCNGREWLERSGRSSSWIRREKRFAIYHRDHFDCVYCRMVFPPATGRGDLTLDHVIPRSQGGSNDASNLVTCCWVVQQLAPGSRADCDGAATSAARGAAADRHPRRSFTCRWPPTGGATVPRVALHVLLTLREGYMFTDACKVLQMSPEQLRREIKLAAQWIGFDRSNRR